MLPRGSAAQPWPVIWSITWSEPARRALDKLDRSVARRIAEAIGRLAETGQGDLLRLRPPLEGHRPRVGDWRIFLSLDDAAGTLTVERIRHRREAYRDR